MFVKSYKYYLRLLEKKPKLSVVQKFLFLLFGLIVIIGGGSSALFYWQYQKETPIRQENTYLEQISTGFVSAEQSVNDLLNGFQVAGVKIQSVDQLKEASGSAAGFYVLLDNVDRTISSIESAQKNIAFQKEQLTKISTPSVFNELHSEVLAYYDESLNLFDNLLKKHRFAKDFLIASGPSFYLPILSNESLWQTGKNDEIIVYYEDIKKEADDTLNKLFHLSPPEDFQEQFKTQIAYLELLVKTANSVLDLLSQSDDQNTENATQIEKSYQTVVGARRENEKLSEKLLNRRLDLVSAKQNLEAFASVKIRQNSLTSNLEDIYQKRQEIKIYQPPKILKKFF